MQKLLTALLASASAALILAAALVMLYDVIMRYAFRSPSLYAPYIAAFLSLGSVFLGTPYALQAGGHVHVELIEAHRLEALQLRQHRIRDLDRMQVGRPDEPSVRIVDVRTHLIALGQFREASCADGVQRLDAVVHGDDERIRRGRVRTPS